MKFFSDFKAFIARGNAMDLAVAVVIGGAFGKIVNSFVNDILMPPIGYLTSGVNVKSWMVTIVNGGAQSPEVAIRYGMFINTIIDFLIISLAIFFVIKLIARMRRKQAEQAPTMKCSQCALSIPKEAKVCGYCGTKT